MLLALFAILAAQGNRSPTIEGRWVNPSGSVVIVIAPCETERLCGTVEWASEKAQADAAKGAPALIGSRLLSDVRAKGGNRWQGKLFVPDKNVRATAKIELTSDDRLKVSGCGPVGLLCKSQLWQRTGPQPD